MKIIHTADIHLDSPLIGVKDAPKRRQKLLQAFVNLAEYAKNNGVQAVVVAGDLFDDEFVTEQTIKSVAYQFVSSESKKAWIHEQFDHAEYGECVACEMEGAAIGQVCCANGVPFGVVRAISDKDDAMDYSMFMMKAADMASRVTERFVGVFE